MTSFMRWIAPPFVILAAAIVVFAVTSIGATGSLPRGSISQARPSSEISQATGLRTSGQAPIVRTGITNANATASAIARTGASGRGNLGRSSGGIMMLVTLLTKSALVIGVPGLATYLAYMFFLQRRDERPVLA